MHFSVNELLKRNRLAIFGERDSAARMKELETIWLPEGCFVDPDGRPQGCRVAGKISRLRLYRAWAS
ncbi:hypothetical protein [Paraburkholderia elongata]|uniref:Uncharacterized protein n=1 Tax=Paraburkholderia elongata TaxID=2675747 RepID=A0A972NKC2_9BURK|nr:hypothetical protein [Paraburkholderia elongata]NPT53839.1 hypothetical protein [Paraburkholderia elongata]